MAPKWHAREVFFTLHYLRLHRGVFLNLRRTWQGIAWDAWRACGRGKVHRCGTCRTVALAKAAAMRVARQWSMEEQADE